MIYREFLTLKSKEIKNNPTYLGLFIQAFEDVMKRTPSCTSCSLNSEYDSFLIELSRYEKIDQEIVLTEKNNKKMKDEKTFVLAINLRDSMLAYVDEQGRDRRKFLERLNDEFVIEYLTHGTPEEIELRKKKFTKFPDNFIEAKEKAELEAKEKAELEGKEKAELEAKEKKSAEKEVKKTKKKEDVISTDDEENFIDPNQTSLI